MYTISQFLYIGVGIVAKIAEIELKRTKRLLGLNRYVIFR